MKKFLAFILASVMILSMAACTGGSSSDNDQQHTNAPSKSTEEGSDQQSAGSIDVKVREEGGKYIVEVSKLPTSVEDLQSFDFTNEYQAGAAVILTLVNCESNYETSLKMLDEVMGPEDHMPGDESFIKNQIAQYPYVMRSYLQGSSPANDYSYDVPIVITFTENASVARVSEGYLQLDIQSSGADSPRNFKLRNKPSTGEWFLFSDTFKGLMAGIRIPASQDKWN